MNAFKDNITDPDFWLRVLYTLLFAVAWQIIELLLGLLLVLQIGFRLFTGQPHTDLAGLGNSLSQYAWQIGRYVTGASEMKPWPFIEWPAADAEWQPRPSEGPVTVEPDPGATSAPVQPVTPAAPPVDPVVSASTTVPPHSPDVEPEGVAEVEPDAPILHPAEDLTQPEPPTVQPLPEDVPDADTDPEDRLKS